MAEAERQLQHATPVSAELAIGQQEEATTCFAPAAELAIGVCSPSELCALTTRQAQKLSARTLMCSRSRRPETAFVAQLPQEVAFPGLAVRVFASACSVQLAPELHVSLTLDWRTPLERAVAVHVPTLAATGSQAIAVIAPQVDVHSGTNTVNEFTRTCALLCSVRVYAMLKSSTAATHAAEVIVAG